MRCFENCSAKRTRLPAALLFCTLLGDASPCWSTSPELFILGVGTHLTREPRPIDQILDRLAEAGVSSFRDDAEWSRVEQERGVLNIPPQWDLLTNAAIKRGIKPLLILDYGNKFYDGGSKPVSKEGIAAFTRYAEFVVRHFKGRVVWYEMWNEWDGGPGNTSSSSADAYARLTRSVYTAIKKIDPNVQLLAGAITTRGIREGFLERLIKQGILENADGISLHSYVHCERGARPEDWARWMQEIHSQLTDLTGIPQSIYITETGWPSHKGACGIGVDEQARYLARLFLLARTMPFIKGVWWYDLQNDGPDPAAREHNFGLLQQDLSPKPAYRALQLVSQLVRDGQYLGQLPISDKGLWALRFTHREKEVVAIWSEEQHGCANLRFALPHASEPSAKHSLRSGQTGSALNVATSSMPQLVNKPLGAYTLLEIISRSCVREK